MLNKKALAGSVSAPPNPFVEDVFSTYLYTGTSSAQTINNGIDLAGKGGLVWSKGRNIAGYNNCLMDTVRSGILFSDTTQAATDYSTDIQSYNSNGFTLKSEANSSYSNFVGTNYASWTFRKQAKFFDVVTYTGNGANRTIAHNLGSVPGSIWVKRTDTTGDWQVYHRSNTAAPETDYLVLNSTAATADSDTRWNDTLPTSTVFSLGTEATVNANSGTYVAYLFAHDAGGFGTAGSDNVISCGSYTGNGSSAGPVVTLGYEPQWILVKRTDAAAPWAIWDIMRGLSNNGTGNDARLNPNESAIEGSSPYGHPTATGFTVTSTNTDYNENGGTYIYIAIRRPMKTPTSGTQVFLPIASSSSTGTTLTTGFPVDMQIEGYRAGTESGNWTVVDRLRSVSSTTTEAGRGLVTSDTAAENTYGNLQRNWSNTGFQFPSYWGGLSTIFYSFRRASGFFDVVCYTGDRSAGFQTITHNLTVSPELIIIKARNNTFNWIVNSSYLAAYNQGFLNLTNAFSSGGTEPDVPIYDLTATTFKVGDQGTVNANGGTFVAYLFATLAGVSKVGSYTGTGTTQTINCGFTAGARFVLIKRTDSTGDWYVWDTARGIVSGNDPYLLLNSTAAEVTNTDYIDPVNSGFELSSTAPAAINANGGSFIFLAVS